MTSCGRTFEHRGCSLQSAARKPIEIPMCGFWNERKQLWPWANRLQRGKCPLRFWTPTPRKEAGGAVEQPHGGCNQRSCSPMKETSAARELLEDIATVCPSALGESIPIKFKREWELYALGILCEKYEICIGSNILPVVGQNLLLCQTFNLDLVEDASHGSMLSTH